MLWTLTNTQQVSTNKAMFTVEADTELGQIWCIYLFVVDFAKYVVFSYLFDIEPSKVKFITLPRYHHLCYKHKIAGYFT